VTKWSGRFSFGSDHGTQSDTVVRERTSASTSRSSPPVAFQRATTRLTALCGGL
jgi:hypothetical protein